MHLLMSASSQKCPEINISLNVILQSIIWASSVFTQKTFPQGCFGHGRC